MFPLPLQFGSFQFLGIPPKGEQVSQGQLPEGLSFCFQFLGIPPKGEPEDAGLGQVEAGGFQFLGIPPKGELKGVDTGRLGVYVSNF